MSIKNRLHLLILRYTLLIISSSKDVFTGTVFVKLLGWSREKSRAGTYCTLKKEVRTCGCPLLDNPACSHDGRFKLVSG